MTDSLPSCAGRFMFDLDQFRAECCAPMTEGKQLLAVREVVARAVEDSRAVRKALGEPVRAEIQTLHRSADLTILNVIWRPRMTVMPHNHNMWAAIGIYTGHEDNILWRRVPDDAGGRTPSRIENRRPPATGSIQAASLLDRTTSTFATTAP